MTRKSLLFVAMSMAASSLFGQYRTYRVTDNGIVTMGYCKLADGQVVHKYTMTTEDGAMVSESEDGSFTVSIPENGNSEERFTVGRGISFEQVFNAIHARYCLRHAYRNFKEAAREKDKLTYQRQIKAIQQYYDNALSALGEDDRQVPIGRVKELSAFTANLPFTNGKPAKGILPEYVRLVENAMKSILVFNPKVNPQYSIVVHKEPLKVETKKGRKSRRR
ncbi:hypothetical protein [Parabacteroides merdae]|jgi:hypothetical protein|uniref:hypothetical protein n=2 Tax=Parabacteroides merdae TaxID=46503 RepID=UPI0034A576F1